MTRGAVEDSSGGDRRERVDPSDTPQRLGAANYFVAHLRYTIEPLIRQCPGAVGFELVLVYDWKDSREAPATSPSSSQSDSRLLDGIDFDAANGPVRTSWKPSGKGAHRLVSVDDDFEDAYVVVAQSVIWHDIFGL